MKVILRTNDFSENFMIVEVLSNPVSDKINLARVKYDEEIFLTGGILIPLNETTFKICMTLSNKDQWDLFVSCKIPLTFN